MSKEADYGILLLAHFSHQQQGRKHSAREVAQDNGLPLPMVRKVLKILAREGLLISHRGARGGYSLVRLGQRITVAEIIKAVEGPLAMTECVEAPGECRLESTCQLKTAWQRINDTVLQALGRMTLSDLTDPPPGEGQPFGGSDSGLVRIQ
ncbi:MAG: SUF system Fe-S cluster assembly regulator [Acidobacteriota bacterium]